MGISWNWNISGITLLIFLALSSLKARIIFFNCNFYEELGSSVSIFSATDWTTGVRSPVEAKDFSSTLCVQTSSKASPTPIQWVPGSFSGGKSRLELEADHLLHLVPRSRMSRSYNTAPPWRLHEGSGRVLLFYFSQC
jgi:hypothetical protein